MKANQISYGLVLIESCRPDNESTHHIRAERDVIYAGSLKWLIHTTIQERLKDIGWKENKDVDGWEFRL